MSFSVKCWIPATVFSQIFTDTANRENISQPNVNSITFVSKRATIRPGVSVVVVVLRKVELSLLQQLHHPRKQTEM